MTRTKPKPIRALFVTTAEGAPDARHHHYLPQLLKKARTLAPGGVSHVTVRHDAWCRLLARRGPCNCHPDVVIETIQ